MFSTIDRIKHIGSAFLPRPITSSSEPSRSILKYSFCVWLLFAAFLAGCAITHTSRGTTSSNEFYEAPWQWVDDSGRKFRLADLRGTPVILSMFYQSCANTCPLTLSRMQELQKRLQAARMEAHFVLVTLDPRHDTVDRLRKYRADHSLDRKHWVLLTGDDDQITALSQALSIHRIDDFTHLIHFTKILVISADGKRQIATDGQDQNQVMNFLSGTIDAI